MGENKLRFSFDKKDRKNSILIVGVGATNKHYNDIVKPESKKEMIDTFGDCQLTDSYIRALDFGASGIYVMNIEKMHDYIADNTKYEDNILYAKANALLLYKRARCSAYTDLLSIYLYKLNIPNYRIASEKHIWNLLYIDNEWLHIDLTWDDPVLSNGKDKTLHDFFLITTKKLEELDPIDKDTNTSSHTYNKEIYKEAN